MHQIPVPRLWERATSKAVRNFVFGVLSGALLAAAHAQPGATREQTDTSAITKQKNEQALQEALRRLLFQQGDFTEAKRLADQARKAGLSTDAKEETQQLFWIADVCHAAGSADIPREDMPDPKETSLYETRVSECVDYREGFGVPQDYAAYRKCLLTRPYTLQENFPIAEIYAKGWGVPRNLKLAKALICRDNAPEMDLQIMLRELEDNGDLNRSCDHGRTLGELFKCGHETRYVERKRTEVFMERLGSTMPAGDRALFEKVLAAHSAFIEIRASSESDTSGQVGRFEGIFEKLQDKKDLAAALEIFEAKQYPTISDAPAADAELNRVYGEVVDSLKGNPIGSITMDGLRRSQRLWLAYRDHFIRFALARYPGTSRAQWLTWLTSTRVEQLKKLQRGI